MSKNREISPALAGAARCLAGLTYTDAVRLADAIFKALPHRGKPTREQLAASLAEGCAAVLSAEGAGKIAMAGGTTIQQGRLTDASPQDAEVGIAPGEPFTLVEGDR